MRRLLATLVALTALLLGGCTGSDAEPAPLATSFPADAGPRLWSRYDAVGPAEQTVKVGRAVTSVRVRISCTNPDKEVTPDLEVSVNTFSTGAGCGTTGRPPSIGLSADDLARDGRVTIKVTPPQGARWSVAVDERRE